MTVSDGASCALKLIQDSHDAARHIRCVASFDELVSTHFVGDVNALCWPRQLDGDFQEIVDRLKPKNGITSIHEDDLAALALSRAGIAARDWLLADQALLQAHGLDPKLDCIRGYPADDPAAPISTQVYSFHVDSAPVPADTYLCTYLGATSEGLPNAAAIRRVDNAEIRARLLELYGGPDDENFAAYLSENSYDLHYSPLLGAKPYGFGLGNLWRIAIAYPACPVAPCIHRAPPTGPGAQPRLLLIS